MDMQHHTAADYLCNALVIKNYKLFHWFLAVRSSFSYIIIPLTSSTNTCTMRLWLYKCMWLERLIYHIHVSGRVHFTQSLFYSVTDHYFSISYLLLCASFKFAFVEFKQFVLQQSSISSFCRGNLSISSFILF